MSNYTNWNRYKREGSDGRAMRALDERKFWQSRMTANGKVAPLPQLVDLMAMAKDIRRGYE